MLYKILEVLYVSIIIIVLGGCGGGADFSPAPPVPSLQSATFSWAPVNGNIINQALTVNGYMLHCGPSVGNLPYKWDMGNVTQYTVAQFPSGIYCCAISAYVVTNSIKVEGASSEAVCP